MKKVFAVGALIVLLTGCGGVVEDVVESCHAGVVYLQLTSGVTVKYNQNGSVVACK